MRLTLGIFTKLDDGAYTGVLKTLHVTTGLMIQKGARLPRLHPA